jgi:ABC-2 type transport system ATP-binding protein
MISMRSLTKRYGDAFAVRELDLDVARGEIFGFIGHNGAGKTTTVNMLTTLLEPTSGTATVAGFDIRGQGLEVRRRIGYLPENVQFYDHMSCYENLEYLANLSGMRHPRERIDEVLAFLDATSFRDKRMGECSKGMRQRVGIAQALVHGPEVLFLDEPTSGLDPFGVKQVRDIILRLSRETGLTIFMNTHMLSEVTQTCTAIGVLSHGRLIYVDTLERTMGRFKDESSLEQIYLVLDGKGGGGGA